MATASTIPPSPPLDPGLQKVIRSLCHVYEYCIM